MKHEELVALLPAVGADSTCWHPQIEALSPRYHVLALDFPLPAAQTSVEGLANHVATAIEAAGYAKAHWVGPSLGGLAALATHQQHPQLVRSLT